MSWVWRVSPFLIGCHHHSTSTAMSEGLSDELPQPTGRSSDVRDQEIDQEEIQGQGTGDEDLTREAGREMYVAHGGYRRSEFQEDDREVSRDRDGPRGEGV